MHGEVPAFLAVRPSEMDFRQSLNFAWARERDWKEVVRCSSSESSCFFSWLSCWTERAARSMVWPPGWAAEEDISGEIRVLGGSHDGLRKGRRESW